MRSSSMSLLAMFAMFAMPTAALKTSPCLHRPSVTSRAAITQMSDVKGPKDWAFIKGVDAAGKENTYMYLDAKKGAEPDRNFLAEFLGLEDNPFAFVFDLYFILLFTPFAIAMAFEASTLARTGHF